jgi:hypothetical protein
MIPNSQLFIQVIALLKFPTRIIALFFITVKVAKITKNACAP